jgi:hypothetical protein
MAAGAVTALAAVCILGGIYWFFLSPDRENHWAYVRARGRIAPIAFKGTVIDQYGYPVPAYDMRVTLYPGGMNARPRDIVITTTKEGGFSFDSGSRKAMAAMIGGNSGQSRGGEWYKRIPNMGGYFVYQGEGEWIWRYDPGDAWKKLEPNTQFVYRIGHMGPPERMISFHWQVPFIKVNNFYEYPPATDNYAYRVNVLTGKVGEPTECADCDIEVRVRQTKTPESQSYVEVIALNGTGVQMARDPFLREAPPDGYEAEALPKLKYDFYWAICPMQVYFRARGGRVYGRMGMGAGGGKMKDLQIDVVANPRGSRNLNHVWGPGDERSPIPLPVTLPFKEDVPFVDARKIWAYADPNKENTLIVEGEKGAVEPGARVSVYNEEASSIFSRPPFRWNVYGDSNEDGSFHLVLDGLEGHAIKIKVSRPTRDSNYDAHIVELAPRWRLAGEGKR